MNPKPQSDPDSMPEYNKFPMPNTIPSGWDVSAFNPVQEPEEKPENLQVEPKKDLWSR